MSTFEQMKPPYVVRADYDRCVYTVVHFDTNKVVASYRYKSESQRARAQGLSNIVRKEMNEDVRNGRAK